MTHGLALALPLTEFRTVIGFWDLVILLQRAQIVHVQLDSLLALGLAARLGHFVALLFGLFKRRLVDNEAAFLGHDPGEVAREAKGVIQSPDIEAVERLGRVGECLLRILVKEGLAAVKRARKRLFLLVQDLLEILDLAVELGEELALRREAAERHKRLVGTRVLYRGESPSPR